MTVESSPGFSRKMLGYGGRILLSVLALYIFLEALRLGGAAAWLFGRRESGRPASPFARVLSRERGGDGTDVGRMWPRFPGSGEHKAREMSLNGARVVSENWEAAAEPDRILDYYRRQMAARGWRDVTEETFGLDPEARDVTAGGDSLQDERYARTYEAMMSSRLVLCDGSWSMHVTVAPGRKGRTETRICAMETPSIKDFAARLAGGVIQAGRSPRRAQALEASESFSGSDYHTVVSSGGQPPARAFEGMLDDLRAEGWRVQVASDGGKVAEARFFALCERDGRYGYLAVADGTDGGGFSAAFTEVGER